MDENTLTITRSMRKSPLCSLLILSHKPFFYHLHSHIQTILFIFLYILFTPLYDPSNHPPSFINPPPHINPFVSILTATHEPSTTHQTSTAHEPSTTHYLYGRPRDSQRKTSSRPLKLLHKVKEDEDKGIMYIPLWWPISKYLNQTVVVIIIQNERTSKQSSVKDF